MIEFIFDLLLITILGLIFTVGVRQVHPLRTVNIKLVVDEDFRSHAHWEQIADHIINASSQEFERQLRIRFKVKVIQQVRTGYLFSAVDEAYVQMLREESRSPEYIFANPSRVTRIRNLKLWSGLTWIYRHIDFENKDLVVFFSGKCYQSAVGCVERALGRMVLLSHRRDNRIEETIQACIHEFGHIFGARHTDRKLSVMHPYNLESRKFDDANRKLILRHKWRNFRKQKIQVRKIKTGL